MASYITESTPLSSLYIQIEYGNTPATLLGVGFKATEAEIRDAYRTFALKVHPDKASPKLCKLHTKLFQKVQAAYDALIEQRAFELNGDSAAAKGYPKQLPESWASIHTRNADAREALREERSRALDSKRAADSKSERTLPKREAFAEHEELVIEGRRPNLTWNSVARTRPV